MKPKFIFKVCTPDWRCRIFLQLLMETKIGKKWECVKSNSNLFFYFFRNHLVKLWLVIRYYKYLFQPENCKFKFSPPFILRLPINQLASNTNMNEILRIQEAYVCPKKLSAPFQQRKLRLKMKEHGLQSSKGHKKFW